MNPIRAALPLVASWLACASAPAAAHHSIKMIDIASPVWLQVTVVKYEPRNPHVLIHVEQRTADGRTRPLVIEGPILARVERMNLARDFLKPGDAIEICGFPFTQDVLASHERLPAGAPDLPALHGQLLVLPDGRWQPWGPYGKLDNCIRPRDTPHTWSAFVNAVPMGHEYWCKGLQYRDRQTAASTAFIDAVNRQLAAPCN